jgi:hypothetical protein
MLFFFSLSRNENAGSARFEIFIIASLRFAMCKTCTNIYFRKTFWNQYAPKPNEKPNMKIALS